MSYTRRTLLQHGAALTALGSVPRPLMAMLGARPEPAPPIEDPRLKRLTGASLQAARTAGAAYADARLTHTYTRQVGATASDQESMTFGVRALVDGYWGFASSPVWTVDEAARLGRAAVQHAKANTLGKSRIVDLAPVAPIANGHWTTPIRDDPFAMSLEEINDFLRALSYFTGRLPYVTSIPSRAQFMKQDKAFASTADQYYTQRLYQTSGDVSFSVKMNGREMGAALNQLTPAGAGFEHIRDQPIREYILALYEEAKEDIMLPVRPLDVGRYDVILDAQSVAGLVSETVGVATELDRALGYEANAGGTSYISDPLAMVGSLKMGTSSMTITGNRSEPGGAATVRWDDEGVTPQGFTLVKDGVLTDMQTNREGAGWLKALYDKQGKSVVSRGCAYAPEAMHPPLTHCANLQLQPATDDTTFESLVKSFKKGLVIKRASMDMDFQQITGLGIGTAYEIKDGKRVALLPGAAINFRTPELWNAVTARGSASSGRRFGLQTSKGQPTQTGCHSVTAVPLALKELAVVDITRKA